MEKEMDYLEKVIDFFVLFLIISGIIWFLYGTYQLIDLLFIRG
jgi:hypothetical protein